MIKHRHQRKETSKSFGDNIEAKRKAAAEQLKEQQKKREDQIKEAIRLKQEQQKANKKSTLSKEISLNPRRTFQKCTGSTIQSCKRLCKKRVKF